MNFTFKPKTYSAEQTLKELGDYIKTLEKEKRNSEMLVVEVLANYRGNYSDENKYLRQITLLQGENDFLKNFKL